MNRLLMALAATAFILTAVPAMATTAPKTKTHMAKKTVKKPAKKPAMKKM